MEIFALIVGLLIAGFIVWFSLKRRCKLGIAAKTALRAQWAAVLTRTDPHRRVLEADAVIAKLLQELGFSGSMGEKLKKAGPLLPGLQDVWNAHKLRNRLAHEPGTPLSERDAARALSAFQRVVDKYSR